MMMTLAMIMISKCLLPAIDFATRYSTQYSDFFITTLLEPYSKSKTPNRWALVTGRASPAVALSTTYRKKCSVQCRYIFTTILNEEMDCTTQRKRQVDDIQRNINAAAVDKIHLTEALTASPVVPTVTTF